MWQYIKKSLLVNLILLILAVLMGYSAYNMLKQASVLYAESQLSYKVIENLARKKQELEGRIAELRDSRAIEREGKERLNLKLPGEEVVVVVPPKVEEKPENESKNPLGNAFKKLLGYIGFVELR